MNDAEAKSVKKIKSSNCKKGYSLLGLNFSNLFRNQSSDSLIFNEKLGFFRSSVKGLEVKAEKSKKHKKTKEKHRKRKKSHHRK